MEILQSTRESAISCRSADKVFCTSIADYPKLPIDGRIFLLSETVCRVNGIFFIFSWWLHRGRDTRYFYPKVLPIHNFDSVCFSVDHITLIHGSYIDDLSLNISTSPKRMSSPNYFESLQLSGMVGMPLDNRTVLVCGGDKGGAICTELCYRWKKSKSIDENKLKFLTMVDWNCVPLSMLLPWQYMRVYNRCQVNCIWHAYLVVSKWSVLEIKPWTDMARNLN